jgi:hypothetical protein
MMQRGDAMLCIHTAEQPVSALALGAAAAPVAKQHGMWVHRVEVPVLWVNVSKWQYRAFFGTLGLRWHQSYRMPHTVCFPDALGSNRWAHV